MPPEAKVLSEFAVHYLVIPLYDSTCACVTSAFFFERTFQGGRIVCDWIDLWSTLRSSKRWSGIKSLGSGGAGRRGVIVFPKRRVSQTPSCSSHPPYCVSGCIFRQLPGSAVDSVFIGIVCTPQLEKPFLKPGCSAHTKTKPPTICQAKVSVKCVCECVYQLQLRSTASSFFLFLRLL